MKKIILFASMAALISCSENKTGDIGKASTQNKDTTEKAKNFTEKPIMAGAKEGIAILDNALKKFAKPSQLFSIMSYKRSTVKGRNGTIIYINPTDLVTENGNPIGKTIDVELKELLSTKDLLGSNAQTISDGRLLVSGGAYYINMTSSGQQLKIKNGASLNVEFPKTTDKTMTLFNGERDSLGRMNWKKTNTDFNFATQLVPAPQQAPVKKEADRVSAKSKITVSKIPRNATREILEYLESDSGMSNLSPKEKEEIRQEIRLNQKIYEAVKLTSFGWINCDRFLNIPEKTDLFVSLNAADSIRYAYFYLVFKDINSIMQSYYFINKTIAGSSFVNIPVGRKVTLIAYSVKNNEFMTYSKDLVIEPKINLMVKLEKTSEDKFKNLLTGS